MKYILFNDVAFFKKNIKFVICLVFIVLFYPIYVKLLLNFDFSKNHYALLLSNIGGLQKINSMYELTILLLLFSCKAFWNLTIISKDFKFGSEYIFLRMEKLHYLCYKITTILFLNFIIEICFLVPLFICYYVLGAKMSVYSMIIIFGCDLVCKCLFDIIFIFMYLFIKKFSLIILLFIIVISSIGKIYIIGNTLYTVNYLENFNLIVWALFLFFSFFLITKFIFQNKYFVFLDE